MSELKACPFCGSGAVLRNTYIKGFQTSIVRCSKCMAEIAKSGLDADVYWNTRTPSPSVREKVEAPMTRDEAEDLLYAFKDALNTFWMDGDLESEDAFKREWNKLLAALSPQPVITTKAEYEAALKQLNILMDVLGQYEGEHYPVASPSPEDAAEFRGDQEQPVEVECIRCGCKFVPKEES